MSTPCFKCGAARGCVHQEYKAPIMLGDPVAAAEEAEDFKRAQREAYAATKKVKISGGGRYVKKGNAP